MGTDFIALLRIGAAASWFRASTKAEALDGLAKQKITRQTITLA